MGLWATQRLLPLVPDGAFARGLTQGRSAALALHAKLQSDARFVTAFPPELDIAALSGLSHEARGLLARLRPRTLGAAGRIAGVRPPDVALLAVHVERLRRARAGTS